MFFYIMFSVTCLFIFQLDLYFSVIENSADGYRHFFFKTCILLDFPKFFSLNAHIFLET